MTAKKKTKYRLIPLLIVKEKQKKRAEIELGKAIKRLTEEKEKLKKFEKEKEEIAQKKKEARLKMSQQVLENESRIYDSSLHLNYLEKLQEDLEAKQKEIEHQKETIQEAEKEVKQARRNYIDASRDLKTMEKHREFWEKKQMKELNREEQKQMNELGNVIHQLRKMGG